MWGPHRRGGTRAFPNEQRLIKLLRLEPYPQHSRFLRLMAHRLQGLLLTTLCEVDIVSTINKKTGVRLPPDAG